MGRFPSRFLAWFTAPASPRPLGILRIALAALCLVRLIPLRDSVLAIWGPYGFVQWAITRATVPAILPHLGDLAHLLSSFGVAPNETVWLVLGLQVAALVGLLLGWRSRTLAAAAFALDVLFLGAGGGLVYGMDVFVHIGLFYLVLMPCGDAFSLDVRAGRRQPSPSVAAGVTRRMLQIQLALVYVSSGFEKAAGPTWWNGDAIWRSTMLPVFRQLDLSFLAAVPAVPIVSGWLVLLTEVGYGLAIWSRRTRGAWLAATLGMHLFIGAFLGMWLFASVMILLNLGAFGPEVLADLADLADARRPRALAAAQRRRSVPAPVLGLPAA